MVAERVTEPVHLLPGPGTSPCFRCRALVYGDESALPGPSSSVRAGAELLKPGAGLGRAVKRTIDMRFYGIGNGSRALVSNLTTNNRGALTAVEIALLSKLHAVLTRSVR